MSTSTPAIRSSSQTRSSPSQDGSFHLSGQSEARQTALAHLEGLGRDMESERRSPPDQFRDPEGVLLRFIERLTSSEYQDSDPHLVAIGYELEALLSIYGSQAVKLPFASRPSSTISTTTSTNTELPPALPSASSLAPLSSGMERRSDSQDYSNAVFDNDIGFVPGERIRYEVTLPVWEQGDVLEGIDPSKIPEHAPNMRVLVSLPPTYPNSSPPQLQLLGRYLGNFGIDSGLFGDVTRTYISSNGVTFSPGDVCVFDGLTHVQSIVRHWYTSNLAVSQEGETAREEERKARSTNDVPHHLIRGMSTLDINHHEEHVEEYQGEGSSSMEKPNLTRSTFSYGSQAEEVDISKLKIISSDPIVDRKSTFIGHAVRITDEKEIPLLINELLNDKKIARAAHPAIFAYRLVREVGGPAGKVYNTDYDDDGETAAGSRLKHLLEILELENVLVVVTRWFGGIQLGPDRFKHINQAARDALELGGFLSDKKDKEDEKSGAKRRGGKK
ncbi:uncharacterized protein I303_101795 [Kwoniella dejecticola CBS 10117]|uniref:RWD domain-containing protein n=1 Tax=Kwoniella dejecticola CBS 10117 TaxID=1296121 RepID=A0A1A6ACS4_9TREE|nr:uncharacterized protein I303_02070 [Kwoniella dejecticola CBS 10117]OBR87856.1 hypothetical protein I303_02070 [Kwoniella dejecticola CBS 10117]